MVEVRWGVVDEGPVLAVHHACEVRTYVRRPMEVMFPPVDWVEVRGLEGVRWIDRYVVTRRPGVRVRPVAWLANMALVELGEMGRWRWVVAAPPCHRWWNLAWLMRDGEPVLAVDLRDLGAVEGVDGERLGVVEMMEKMGGGLVGG